jgi:GTPase SAR1 family protein
MIHYTRPLEIKIALLGNVSAGKTTVLNALLRDKFGEMGRKRTTLGANFFYIHTKHASLQLEDNTWKDGSTQNIVSEQKEDNPRSSSSILQEISDDNLRIRENYTNDVQEKHFHVELEEEIIPMSKNKRLVIVDVPGITEAEADEKYRQYVLKLWHTFDCVILVLDGKKDDRMNEQTFILNLVKDNLIKRNIPVIVLCNKLDKIDEEYAELVQNVQDRIESIFNASSCGKKLKAMLEDNTCKRSYNSMKVMSPIFIPISMIHAYIYRAASRMDFVRFKSLSHPWIDVISREMLGSVRCGKLSDEEKAQEVYDIVKNPIYYEEGMMDCNFDLFRQVLNYILCGELLQKEIIWEKINLLIDDFRLNDDLPAITSFLRMACEDLGQIEDAETLKEKVTAIFWPCYESIENTVFSQLVISPMKQSVSVLAMPMDDLISYHRLCQEAGWFDEELYTINTVKGLVRRVIGSLLEQQNKDIEICGQNPWFKNSGALSPYDWELVWQSFLLMSSDPYFIEEFGKDLVLMKTLTRTWPRIPSFHLFSNCCVCCKPLSDSSTKWKVCSYCKIFFGEQLDVTTWLCHGFQLREGQICTRCGYVSVKYRDVLDLSFDVAVKKWVPAKKANTIQYICVEIPQSISDTNHFGHIVWKYCQFMKTNAELPFDYQNI